MKQAVSKVACTDVGLYRNKDDLECQAQSGLQLVFHSSPMGQCRHVALHGPLPCLCKQLACCQVHADFLSGLLFNPEDRGDKFLLGAVGKADFQQVRGC